ncbi:DUF975 family protein [Anaerostipes sp.]|uniref:DUF975 family protein n=1 Tax=Anaerostipes sp. TaxID=1872530 RepID=UPI0025BA39B3|nr:DUF975 family protein [Anaerostipes sp.]
MRERMKFKDIRGLAKERAKESLNTLILMEVIIIIISLGIQRWGEGLVTLFPFLPFLLLIDILAYILVSLFWTGNTFSCVMVTIGMKAEVDHIFYGFKHNRKEILWLLLRKILIIKVYIALFSIIGNFLCEMFQLDNSYMYLIAYLLAYTVVELRYFPALYLLLDGEEQKCGLSVSRGIRMMKGNYLRLILLSFSFLPWILVGLLLCGLGILIVAPWIQISFVIFYMELKQQEKKKYV